MNYQIRPYKHSDFQEIANWWFVSTNQLPTVGGMIEDGTFVLELNNEPALCLTTLLTQSKQMAYVTSFIKNPKFTDSLETYGKLLWNHCFDYAKSKGYQQVICFSQQPKLVEKYQRFGMKPTMNNLTSFSRIL